MNHNLEKIDQNKIDNFCKQNGIKKLSFFGSVLTDKFSDESDIDILVEFLDDSIPGLLGLSRMERELSIILSRKADIRTKEDLSILFRDSVIKESEVKYGA